MREIKCPTCGKVLKVIKEDSIAKEKKKITFHCNKCNSDIEIEV